MRVLRHSTFRITFRPEKGVYNLFRFLKFTDNFSYKVNLKILNLKTSEINSICSNKTLFEPYKKLYIKSFSTVSLKNIFLKRFVFWSVIKNRSLIVFLKDYDSLKNFLEELLKIKELEDMKVYPSSIIFNNFIVEASKENLLLIDKLEKKSNPINVFNTLNLLNLKYLVFNFNNISIIYKKFFYLLYAHIRSISS